MEISTYTMWDKFRNCQKLYELRYERQLVPNDRDRNLILGEVIHEALATWHWSNYQDRWKLVMEQIDDMFRKAPEWDNTGWINAKALMAGYMKTYPFETWKCVDTEIAVEGTIRNPRTTGESRTWNFHGKVDGLIKRDGEYWILEHKTASTVDAAYLDRLWMDFQIGLYTRYMQEHRNIQIAGVIYNVLQKARLKQAEGETDGEYQTRRAEAIAKSKTGKTSIKQKIAESDEEYMARLVDKYLSGGMFYREEVLFDQDMLTELQSQLWEMSQAALHARRRGEFYRNTAYCFKWNKPCEYLQICRSGENPAVIENLYHIEPPHQELVTEVS